MEFVIVGKTEQLKDDIKKVIQRMGGKLGTKLHENVAAVISTEDEVKRMGSKMREAKNFGIQVIPEDFLDDVKKNGGAVSYITSKSLCDWGTDVRRSNESHIRVPTTLICFPFHFNAAAHANPTGRLDQIEIEEHLHKVRAKITNIEVER